MHGRQGGGLPVVFLSVDLGGDPFKRQGAVHEHDLAIGFAGHALGFQIQRVDVQPVIRETEVRCQRHRWAAGLTTLAILGLMAIGRQIPLGGRQYIGGRRARLG